MITITKMPLYTLNSDVTDKEQVSFGDNRQEKLEKFADETNLKGNVRIGHNMFEIKVLSNNLVDWDEDTHELFCGKFNAILYSIRTEETITAKEMNFMIMYTYIPRFVKQKYNDEFSVDWGYINAMLP